MQCKTKKKKQRNTSTGNTADIILLACALDLQVPPPTCCKASICREPPAAKSRALGANYRTADAPKITISSVGESVSHVTDLGYKQLLVGMQVSLGTLWDIVKTISYPMLPGTTLNWDITFCEAGGIIVWHASPGEQVWCSHRAV